MDDLLPLDILLDIFSRLDIKSVIRFKSVSKACLFLSSHPLLPNLHFSRPSSSTSSASQSVILFSDPSIIPIKTNLYLLDLDQLSSSQTPIKLTLPFHVWLNNFIILASCNGLLCLSELSTHSHDTYIYNPSTSDYFQIPDFHPNPTPTPTHLSFLTGFGFDPISKKYKLVRIVTNTSFFGEFVVKAHVYTIGSSSTWRKKTCLDGMHFIDQTSPCVHVNGVLHWKGYKSDLSELCVVYFNLGTEELGVFDLPNSFDILDPVHVSFMAFEGCFSIFHLKFHRLAGYRIVIWFMKDYGVEESWTKEFVIRDSPIFKLGIMRARPLCFNKDGEIILVCGGQQLVAYEPRRKSYRDLGYLTTSDPVMAIPYSGSLLPIVG